MKRFLRLFRRSAADRELADEMREHLDEKVDDLVAQGMTREASASHWALSVATSSHW
jgi:hypothetical protein